MYSCSTTIDSIFICVVVTVAQLTALWLHLGSFMHVLFGHNHRNFLMNRTLCIAGRPLIFRLTWHWEMLQLSLHICNRFHSPKVSCLLPEFMATMKDIDLLNKIFKILNKKVIRLSINKISVYFLFIIYIIYITLLISYNLSLIIYFSQKIK